MLRAGTAPRILSVSQLAGLIRDTLQNKLGMVWVAGEISNLRRQPSGHCYFTLKDDQSQLSAVMFQSVARVLPFKPADGMEVVAYARVSIYPVRGQLQLYVDSLEPRGLGALQLAFEQLKARLGAEGLFAAERKRPLPRWPRAVGIVTALRGAAVHDMRTVLRRRWPMARVVIRPVRVQGAGAAREIADGIADLNGLPGVDVLIVGRGGGSLEDLWAFNEEVVARAIVGSRVPVVSAVGHEVDFTIADFVADARAPTPTAAAALVVPDAAEVSGVVARAGEALRGALGRRMVVARERLVALEQRLGDPQRRVIDTTLRIDELAVRARRALGRRLAWDARELEQLAARLARHGIGPGARRARERLDGVPPRLRFALEVRVRHARAALEQLGSRLGRHGIGPGPRHVRERLDGLPPRLRFALAVRVRQSRAALEHAAARLNALSPLACLERGYAIVRRGDRTGPVVTDAASVVPGDEVALVFARGRARARIEGTED